ncbi:HEPN domain-containing protein [Acidianus ambivalens]|uniref:HEPN domain-containing protein n=1 Tax=Acidianus ambivalens TaxID=2283 RepID=UPI002011B3EB|nr:HEPN domain-containing protein [Acidianus ambivalens]
MHELPFCRRSLEYLKAAEDSLSEGLYDGVLSQISAELSIKATISFLGFPETHELRKLLSLLSSLAMKSKISQKEGEEN